MTNPKRHHWWPMVQSRYWTDTDGLIFVSRSDGTYFRTNPLNIGVESELYTRFGDGDTKDTKIEEWFANTIDNPAKIIIEYLLDTSNVRRKPFQGDRTKAETLKSLGFRVRPYVEYLTLTAGMRDAIARYLAALLVRHPTYLAKLMRFHRSKGSNNRDATGPALDNMLHIYNLYAEKIRESILIVTRRAGSSEYLYADGGLKVEEPWRKSHGLPFDMHAPITPDFAVAALPLPMGGNLAIAPIFEATNEGVARQNRIILSVANRFVFSRKIPPSTFIANNFGKPAPKNIGFRFVDGRLETRYDPSRK